MNHFALFLLLATATLSQNSLAAGNNVKLIVYQSVSCQSPGSNSFSNSTNTEVVSMSNFEKRLIFNLKVDQEILTLRLQTVPDPDGIVKLTVSAS